MLLLDYDAGCVQSVPIRSRKTFVVNAAKGGAESVVVYKADVGRSTSYRRMQN